MRSIAFLLVVILLTNACASVPYHPCPPGVERCQQAWGYGGSGPPEPPPQAWGEPGRTAIDWWADADEEARADEASLAIDDAWAVASPVDGEGAVVQLTFYESGGALTLERHEMSPPARRAASSGENSFRAALRGKATQYAGTRPRWVTFTLRRGTTGWELTSFSADEAAQPPPAGRTLPVKQAHVPEDKRQHVERLTAALARTAHAPGHPGDEWELEMQLEDDQLLHLSTLRYQSKGKATSEPPQETLPWELANEAVAFLPAVGRRKVHLVLKAQSVPGQARPRWYVALAATQHERPPELEEFGTSYAEYRLLEEGILKQWRERTREYAQTAALFTAREVAIWLIAGWVLHGAGMVVELAGSPLWRIVRQVGPEAVDWMETLLMRVPDTEREALLRLWGKMQKGGGADALSTAEQRELSGVLERVEQIAFKPLNDAEKRELRTMARPRFDRYHPELVGKLVGRDGTLYPIHHDVPLEYAHLVPEVDVNAAEHLVAVSKEVHDSISSIWTLIRSYRVIMRPDDLRKIVAIINRYYRPWYNVVYNPASATQLAAAEAAARHDIRILLLGMEAQ